MSYPYVAAYHDYGPRKGPALAFVVHMAEGGGTVGFLSRANARGVSVHYVIEYSGRIVQMLSEDHASGSIDPTLLRTTDDPDHLFGVTAARAALGAWWRDPNSAVISLEIEGFAGAGPAAVQLAALAKLAADVRSRHAGIGMLGHRDFAEYKACPGRHIDWPALGGHGPSGKVPDVTDIDVARVDPVILDVPAGAKILNLDGSVRFTSTGGRVNVVSPFVSTSAGGTALRAIVWTEGAPSPALLLAIYGNAATNVRPGADCAPKVAAETARLKAKIVTAVENVT